MVEWNGSDQPQPIKYFIPEYLFIDIGYVVQYSYERPFDIDLYCVVHQYSNKWKLTINRDFAESDNKKDMEELKQIIKAALNVALTKDDFSRLKEYKKDAEREHRSFVNGIIKIIKNIENGIPLKGKCEICKNY